MNRWKYALVGLLVGAFAFPLVWNSDPSVIGQTVTVDSTQSPLVVNAAADLADLTPTDGQSVIIKTGTEKGLWYYDKDSSATVADGFVLNGPGSVGRFTLIDSAKGSFTVATVADLATARPADGDIVSTLGYTTAGVGANMYRYDANSAATIDGGWVINGPGSVGRYIALNQTYADPTQFGADPTGAADSLAAFRACVGSCHASTLTKTIQVPGGTFALSGHLFLYGDVSIEGIGDESTIALDGDISTPIAGYWINCGIQSILGTRTNWTGSISKLRFTATANAAGMRACIFLHNATDFQINNNFFDWQSAPEAVQDYAQWSVEGFNNAAWNTASGNPRARGQINFNRVKISQQNDGMEALGLNFGDDCQFIGNYIYGNGDDVIGLHGCNRCIVSHNICHSVDGRIVTNSCADTTVSNNYLTRCPDKDGVWHAGGAFIFCDLEFGGDVQANNNLVIANNIINIPEEIPNTSMYGIRLMGVRNSIIEGNVINSNSPAGTYAISIEKGAPPADWTGPTDDIDYDATPPGVPKSRNVKIVNNISNGKWPGFISMGGVETDFPGQYLLEGNTARGFIWFAWNSKIANNSTTIGDGVGFKYMGLNEDMPVLADFSFSGLNNTHVTGSRLSATVGGQLAKLTHYLKSSGRIMGMSVQSDTAVTGGGSVLVALYRNGVQVGTDYDVGATINYWTDFYNADNFAFDNNILTTTTDEDYWEVKLYTSGTVGSTHAGIVRLYAMYDTQSKDNLSYNFANTDVDTGADTITLGTHGLVVGDRVVFRTNGTIFTSTPATSVGILNADVRYVQSITATGITVSATDGGAAIDITAQGTGTHTVTKFPY